MTTISGPHGRFDHTVGGHHQLWTVADLEPYLGNRNQRAHVFLCGPCPMVDELTRVCGRGLSGDHVHTEDFAFR